MFSFATHSSHLHPLQVEKCDRNLRLVVDEDNNSKLKIKSIISYVRPLGYERVYLPLHKVAETSVHIPLISRANPVSINPLTAKLFNLNFHPLEVVSC